MAKFVSLAVAVLFVSGAALASDLNLTVRQAGGGSSIVARPGEVISYEVVGELSDNLNQGLAMFSVDICFDGTGFPFNGVLPAADEPVGNPTLNFDRPAGVTNPAGYGGTIVMGGELLQVGGAQNTIQNSFAPYPVGTVITGVAANGSPEVLVTGTFTAPMHYGDYTLSIDPNRTMANAIRTGSTGNPFWEVDRVGPGTIVNLDVTVVSLTASTPTISLSAGGTANFSIDGGDPSAARFYWLGGSLSGTSPGMTLVPGLVFPLNFDGFTNYTIFSFNNPPYADNLGQLDGTGRGPLTAGFVVPPASDPLLNGLQIYNAFSLFNFNDFVSNPVTLTLTP